MAGAGGRSGGNRAAQRGERRSVHGRAGHAGGDPCLQAIQALGQSFKRQIRFRTGQPGESDLQHQTHVAGVAHLKRGIVQNRQDARQAVGVLKEGSLLLKRRRLLGRAIYQLGLGAGDKSGVDVAHVSHQVARELHKVVALVHLRAHQAKELNHVARRDAAGELGKNGRGHLAQKRAGICQAHGAPAKDGELLQGGKRVAHAAAGVLGHDLQRFLVI